MSLDQLLVATLHVSGGLVVAALLAGAMMRRIAPGFGYEPRIQLPLVRVRVRRR